MRFLMMKRKVKKVFDYSKLRGKIKEVFGTQAKFAKAMGMSTVTLSAKLNGTDFADQILDVFQSIQGAIEVEVDYKADAFNPITIKEVFDC